MKHPALSTPKSISISDRSGQSIIEIIVSIGLAALIISSLIILGSASLKNTLSSARRTEGTRLAVSGLEAMRFYRDTQGFAALVPGCYFIDQTDGSLDPVGTPTSEAFLCTQETSGWVLIDLANSNSDGIFMRKIKVENYGGAAEQARMRKVTSTIRWPEGNGGTVGGVANQKSVVMSVVLTQWE